MFSPSTVYAAHLILAYLDRGEFELSATIGKFPLAQSFGKLFKVVKAHFYKVRKSGSNGSIYQKWVWLALFGPRNASIYATKLF